MENLGKGYREIEIQANGLQWERLHFRDSSGKTYREKLFHPITPEFKRPGASWESSVGIPSDAEFIGNYLPPVTFNEGSVSL